MNHIEIIRIFRRVAETKSFSGVAKELGLTQPTISKAILNLEREIGSNLFRRTTRGLSLTNEGHKLYNSSGPLIDHFEQVFAEVKSQKLNLSGELRISASLAFSRLILAPRFTDFSQLHPELRFNFVLSDGFVDLIENNIDIALRIGDLPDSQLRAVKIGISRRKIYASKKYLKKFGEPKNLSELENHRLLYYTRIGDQCVWPLYSGQKSRPFVFKPFLKSDGSDLMRESVIEGLGIALMPTWMMIDRTRNHDVVEILEDYSTLPSPIYAVTTASRDWTAKQRAFIDFCRLQFEEIEELRTRP